MNTFELITNAGLPKHEAEVYASLVENGQQSITDLFRSTQIHRPTLYQLLPRLERRGLVSKVKVRNRFQYVAESPRKLLGDFEARITLERAGLAELAERFEQRDTERPVVKYLDGERSLKFVFNDVIHTLPVGGEFYRYSSRLETNSEQFAHSRYAKERDQRRIERLVITSEAKAKRKVPKLERSVRAVPPEFDLFEDNVSLLIYGNKTAYIDYGSNTSFIIESEKIARFQQKLFKLLWKRLS
jgi:sugar-specific transcriptional regulator TrmB